MAYKHTSEVRMHGGIPSLFVDGAPVPAAAYMSYLDERARYADFADAGYKMFFFPVFFAGRSINVLSGISPFRRGIFDIEDKPDYTETDRELAQITAACPDAMIIPRVNIMMPQWWEDKNPSELNRIDNGAGPSSFPACRESFSSQKWRETAVRLLDDFIDHIESTQYAENIIGYHIAGGGTEEWFHFGSPHGGMGSCAERGYLRYIAEYYPAETGEIHTLPSFAVYESEEKIITDKNIIRFLEYTNHIVADSLCYIAAAVKRKTDRRLVVGCFYGYTFELTDARYGTHALGRVLRCPDIDFLASPSSYMCGRAPGIDAACMTVMDSVKLHGKLYFTENDNRTYLTRPLEECRPDSCKKGTYRGGVWEGPPDRDVSVWLLRSCFARNLTHGAGQWWFDMWGGWYADSIIMGEMKAYLDIAAESLKDSDRTSAAEAAVIISEESYRYTNPCHPTVHTQNYMNRLPLGLCGVPYDAYDIADIDSLPDRIKAVVFLNIAGRRYIADDYMARHPEKMYLFTSPEDTGPLTTQILRSFYRKAGVHIYTETDDVVHANANYIAIHASSEGDKTIRLKKRAKIQPLHPSGADYVSDTINIKMRRYETGLYRLTQ